ncbi:tryptophanyl-tRNA synthetase [Orenia metallireducens]|jgi:tryptophanyl-tRNA synthetase|uniref:Tryptophan--tRNA ligase n=1 Tax=Orenia metallireducens TaxID=1413210 RepID=A0A285HMN6_9FIRM|nr:tryptophan--tRNA ligase [Orenia metallireducens]PRX26675.1 tryptophanyl-tRNA synthetase [Orenia metallireducens]SNY36026.1 tryptophanyl-tRNA synthetase [Orenia metallireducens]
MSKKGTIFSGMRPTGKLHLGHLIGVLDNWKQLQDEYNCIFEVADWHALTTKYEDTEQLQNNIRGQVIDWIAAGIDPERSIIFVQSHIPEIAELNLLLSMIISVSRLERNPTYKEQVQELGVKDSIPFGLLEYPVLQAADILAFKGDTVPVGEDQLPHIEITRELARRFNHLYVETFPEPEAKLGEVTKLLGLDGRKMSKSYGNSIYLADSPEEIARKVKSMVTDPQRIRLKDPGDPEVCSVYSYHKLFTPDRVEEVAEGCRNATLGCMDCKKILSDSIIDYLSEIHEKRKELEAKPEIVDEILAEGANKARAIAKETLTQVRTAMNLR